MKLTKILFALCMIALPMTFSGCDSGGTTVNEDAPVMTETEEQSYEEMNATSGSDEDQN